MSATNSTTASERAPSTSKRIGVIAGDITPGERAAATQHLASVIMPAFHAWCERHAAEAARG